MLLRLDQVNIGDEVGYREDGAHWLVRLKEKSRDGKMMSATFIMVREFRTAMHGGRSPEIGAEFSVSVRDGEELNVTWHIDAERQPN